MKGLRTAIAGAALFASSVAADVPSIVIKGSKFFYENNGTQFFIKGVAYQQDYTANATSTSSNADYTDPLTDSTQCARDIPYLVKLQTNTIRVYAINPDENHDDCMSMLADAGIYVIADLSSPSESINRDDASWDVALYERYTSVIDTMQKYSNTMGFFAGNEVSNAPNNTEASAFVKAAVRDMKAYIKAQGYRTIGVGYATNDDADIRINLADYFNCGDQTDAIDFWGYNIYSWCGDTATYQSSGYQTRTQEFENYSVPVFFAEYGCNEVEPRTFTEVAALYGPQMSPIWSGGIVYMYFQEANNFGLVSIDGDTVSTRADYSYLSKQIATISPSAVNSADYNPTNTAPQSCPAMGSTWAAEATPLPPTPNAELCSCIVDTLSCVVKDSVDETDYQKTFDYLCGLQDGTYCKGIHANGTTPPYGAYGMCEPKDKLSFIMNAYYEAQNQEASACDFSNSATLTSASSATGSCSALVKEAGTAGTGTVTSAPTGTAGSGSSASSSGAAVTPLSVTHFDFGMIQLGAYLVMAAVSGAGMILL